MTLSRLPQGTEPLKDDYGNDWVDPWNQPHTVSPRVLPVARHFECFFNFLGWWHWSIGVHVDLRHPHIDVHVPFGFARLGWLRSPTISAARCFGYRGWRIQR